MLTSALILVLKQPILKRGGENNAGIYFHEEGGRRFVIKRLLTPDSVEIQENLAEKTEALNHAEKKAGFVTKLL